MNKYVDFFKGLAKKNKSEIEEDPNFIMSMVTPTNSQKFFDQDQKKILKKNNIQSAADIPQNLFTISDMRKYHEYESGSLKLEIFLSDISDIIKNISSSLSIKKAKVLFRGPRTNKADIFAIAIRVCDKDGDLPNDIFKYYEKDIKERINKKRDQYLSKYRITCPYFYEVTHMRYQGDSITFKVVIGI